MTFDALIEQWQQFGLAGVVTLSRGPLLIPLEPWLLPADTGRLPLRTSGVPGPPVAELGPNDTTTELSVTTLTLVHSELGDRYPVARIPVQVVTKTDRNVYAHVAVGRSIKNDIVIDQPSVSRFHADFRQMDGRLMVRDAKSRNGTRLNGDPLTSAHGEPIRTGDVVSFGEACCVFCEVTEAGLRRVLGSENR